jgi:flagellar hook-length control protein FliK
MITVKSKEVASSLSLTPSAKQSSLDSGSFAELLQTLSSKTLKDGALVLQLKDKKSDISTKQAVSTNAKDLKNTASSTTDKNGSVDTKKSDILSLLKGEEKNSTMINPALSDTMDQKQLKSLMKDAKNYLAEQIKNTDAYKKGEIKELPKSVQGLVALAKKVGIDVSKITVETVQTKTQSTSNLETLTPAQTKLQAQTTSNTAVATLSQTQLKASQQTQTDSSLQQLIAKKEDSSTAQSLLKNETKTKESKEQTLIAGNKLETKQSVATHTQEVMDQKNEPKIASLKVGEQLPKMESTTQDPLKNSVAKTQKQEILTQQNTQNISDTQMKNIPLFVSENQVPKSHSTAELVGKNTLKNSQEQTSNTQSLLSALLHTNKQPLGQTASQDVQKEVKADSSIKANSTVLSQLLHGENNATSSVKGVEQNSAQTKSESTAVLNQENGLHVKQAETDLGVKMNEAKQMVKYLAHDIKQAIEDYKPPFTRIKVKLNPEKLGEIDLTVIQRGKNVHVSISSNSAAIASLAQNANELKSQLAQNGMNNASLNFNSSADTQTQQQQQQQQQQQTGHQRESAKKAYEAFSSDETNEEILSSLEIVIPRYA